MEVEKVEEIRRFWGLTCFAGDKDNCDPLFGQVGKLKPRHNMQLHVFFSDHFYIVYSRIESQKRNHANEKCLFNNFRA